MAGNFKRIVKSRFVCIILNVAVISLLIFAALLWLPISPVGRLFDPDFTPASPNSGAVQAPDGAKVTILPPEEGLTSQVTLEILARDSFLAGASEASFARAAQRIPPNLTIAGSIYHLQHRESPPKNIVITLPIPEAAESQARLDIYTWNGGDWAWQASRKVRAENLIEAELDFVPELVVVMESQPLNPMISADHVFDLALSDAGKNGIFELAGLVLDANGQIRGNQAEIISQNQAANLPVVPTIRNWDECHPIYASPVDMLLTEPEARDRHISAIVALVQNQGYHGIEIDYRAIRPALRQAYTAFVAELRQALPAEKQLYVQIGLPQQANGAVWDTAGYDLPAIGRLADLVKLPISNDPGAYTPGGQMEAMLDWAVGQVNRYKLQLIFSANSTEWVAGTLCDLNYQQALQRLGAVTLAGKSEIIAPNQELNFTLSGLLTSAGVQVDDTRGVYWFTYYDPADRSHTLYFENTAGLIDALRLAKQYSLRGVAIAGLWDNIDKSQIWAVIQNFLNETKPPVESHYLVEWRVQTPAGQVIAAETVDLSQPDYQWTAPAQGGDFEISASISSSYHPTPVSQGYILVQVPTPTAVLAATPSPASR
jgi:spore germination protein YaaH